MPGPRSEPLRCYRGLAVLLAQEGRLSDAFRLLEGWADRQPGLADPKIELARLYEEFGNRAAAKDATGRGPDGRSEQSPRPGGPGQDPRRQGETCQALANYQRSLWYDPSQPAVAARIAAIQGFPAPGTSALLRTARPDGHGPANPSASGVWTPRRPVGPWKLWTLSGVDFPHCHAQVLYICSSVYTRTAE